MVGGAPLVSVTEGGGRVFGGREGSWQVKSPWRSPLDSVDVVRGWREGEEVIHFYRLLSFDFATSTVGG